jgi:hypothetical protein
VRTIDLAASAVAGVMIKANGAVRLRSPHPTTDD